MVRVADERVLDVQFSDDAISVSLRDGRVITVPLVWYPRLLDATATQRKNWKIAGGGYGIHWPDVERRAKGWASPQLDFRPAKAVISSGTLE